jgi:hypothetical protein
MGLDVAVDGHYLLLNPQVGEQALDDYQAFAEKVRIPHFP